MEAVKLLQGAVDSTTRTVGALTPEHEKLPTPCEDWDVHTLVAHLTGVTASFTDAASGRQPDEPVPMSELEGYLIGEGEKRIAGGPVDGYRETARACAAAWQQRGADGTVFLPAGVEVPATMAVGIVSLDTLVHGWDIARAIGADTEIDPSIAEAGLETARGFVNDQMRGTAYGHEVEVPADASPTAQLVAFMGRKP
jgi:uncharacterized protein (TIGR03086 family)